MPSVTVRNLEPGTVSELRILAAKNGRSMQAELRRMILRHVDSPAAQAEDPSKLPIALLAAPEWYDELFEFRAIAFGLRDAEVHQWRSPMRDAGAAK